MSHKNKGIQKRGKFVDYSTDTSESSVYDTSSSDEITESSEDELFETVIIKKKNNRSINEKILRELGTRQLPNLPTKWKLSTSDMRRICKGIDKNPFNKDECVIWTGYVTNANNASKGKYINFYFRNHKVALHRILYSNYIDPLTDNDYIKFSCENKGVCCNINHYERYKYSKRTVPAKKPKKKSSKKKIKKKPEISNSDSESGYDSDNMIINFD